MLCETAFDLISGHIDGTNTPAEEAALQAHLSACEACRRSMDAMTAIEYRTRTMQQEAPPQLKANIMQAIAAEAKQKSAKQRRRWVAPVTAVGAVAAALALMLGTGVVKLPQFGSDYAKSAQTAAPALEAADYDTPYAAEEPAAAAEEAFWGETEAAVYNAPTAAFAPEEEAPGDSAVQTDGWLWDSVQTETAAEESVGGSTQNTPLRTATVASAEAAYCEQLCTRYSAPVLLVRGCDASLTEALDVLSPALGEQLDTADRLEDDDRLVLVTDVDTAFALAEWLYQMLPQDADKAADEDTAFALERIAEYDPENACIEALLELPEEEGLHMLRELYAALYGEDGGLTLIYPDEDYEPLTGDPVYIVLPMKADD